MLPIRRAALAATIATLTAPTILSQTTAVVSPLDRATLEGSSSTTYPLGRFDCRLQQIHDDLGPGARTLSGHAYRRDALALRGLVGAFTTELEVLAAPAAVTPAQASSTFATNRGTGGVIVLPRTVVSFPSTTRPVADPAPTFEFRIPWSTPFSLPAGATLCLDLTVHGNQTASGTDRNFTPYLDAHQLYRDGRNVQPGYRFGDGCTAQAGSTAHTGRFELITRFDGSLHLEVDSRDGAPTVNGVAAMTVLLIGAGVQPVDLPFKPGCRLLPTIDALVGLPGPNDSAGDWGGSMTIPNAVPPRTRFYAQLASGVPGVDLTLSDGSVITVPPLAPSALSAARVAHGSDRTSSTGTVSTTVPVTEFF